MRRLLTITLISVLAFWLAVELYTQDEATFAATESLSDPTGRSVEEARFQECTAGVADGDVTVDGRPLLWKLRNQVDVTNDVHHFVSGVQHYPGLSPAIYSYLGMGPANDSPEGPVRQGLNSQGLAVGWNVLNSSGWQQLHHQALGHYNTVSQVRMYVNEMTDLSTYNYFIDTVLSAKSLARSFFRHDTLARDDTVSNMIVHGVLPTEDPRLSTTWTLLGHSETGIFVPVWIHGVESDGANKVPQYLDTGDDGVCVYAVAKGMHNASFNEADDQARTLPFEEHLFDVVNNKLLPDWRSRDWTDSAAVAVIGNAPLAGTIHSPRSGCIWGRCAATQTRL
jgi:hypothetical protein